MELFDIIFRLQSSSSSSYSTAAYFSSAFHDIYIWRGHRSDQSFEIRGLFLRKQIQ